MTHVGAGRQGLRDVAGIFDAAVGDDGNVESLVAR